MKKLNLDFYHFNDLMKMLNNEVYWLDKYNNYKIYKFEVVKVSFEKLNGEFLIWLELYPVSTVLLKEYRDTLEIKFDENIFENIYYSYEKAKTAHCKKMRDRQGSLF